MASQGLGTASASSALSAQAEPVPIIRFLVVCGAFNKHDSSLFGNFVGFHRAITALGEVGQFFNAFPVEEYFDSSLQFHNIKFGRASVRMATY